MSSEGWNCSAPTPTQRRAPFTSIPMPGSITATSRPKLTRSSIGVARRTASRPWRERKRIPSSPIAP